MGTSAQVGVSLDRVGEDRRGDWGLLGGLSFAIFAAHMLVSWRYGYFVDELYYLACSHHLAWGYELAFSHFARGPAARLELPHHVSLRMHCFFSDGRFFVCWRFLGRFVEPYFTRPRRGPFGPTSGPTSL